MSQKAFSFSRCERSNARLHSVHPFPSSFSFINSDCLRILFLPMTTEKKEKLTDVRDSCSTSIDRHRRLLFCRFLYQSVQRQILSKSHALIFIRPMGSNSRTTVAFYSSCSLTELTGTEEKKESDQFVLRDRLH